MSNVIHGTGKPRFYVKTGILETGKIVSVSGLSAEVDLYNFESLTDLDSVHGLIGVILWSLNASGAETFGVIKSYASETVAVKYWSNGAPVVDAEIKFQGIVIDLPYCQRLIERWTPEVLTVKRLNGRIRKKKKRFYYSATLDYSQYLGGDKLSLLRHLFRTDRNEIIFYPRVDNNNLYYNVEIADDSLEIYQLQHHQAHGGIRIQIIGLEPYSEAQIFNLLNETGYGYNYGTDYGIGL